MKHLLPNVPHYFKANLHTHTTVSDGKYTPEEVKEIYKSRGYQILAFTDHEKFIPHQELNDTDFLALDSYELSITETDPGKKAECYHLNLFAKDPENPLRLSVPAEAGQVWETEEKQLLFNHRADRQYSVEYANRVIAAANKMGFLVAYNHPTWSQQEYPDYIGLKGLWGMEVYNHTCVCLGYEEYNDRVYQDLLCQGNGLFPVASDDFHHFKHGAPAGGWVMVGAEQLEYTAVIKALEQGDFYASTGPQIHSLTLEGTTLRLRCSEAASVTIRSHRRQAARFLPEEGNPLEEVTFDIAPWLEKWATEERDNAFIRLTVTDAAGRKANTRAYWYRELI